MIFVGKNSPFLTGGVQSRLNELIPMDDSKRRAVDNPVEKAAYGTTSGNESEQFGIQMFFFCSMQSISINSQKAKTFMPIHNPKFESPLHYAENWHRDGLISLALDGSIGQVSPCPVELNERDVVIVLITPVEGHEYLLAFTGEEVNLNCDHGGMRVIQRSRHAVMAEPARTGRAAVWASRNYPATVAQRLAVHAFLQESGGNVVLGDFAPDLLNTVARLAVDAEISIDLANGLHAGAIVTFGSLAPTQEEMKMTA